MVYKGIRAYCGFWSARNFDGFYSEILINHLHRIADRSIFY